MPDPVTAWCAKRPDGTLMFQYMAISKRSIQLLMVLHEDRTTAELEAAGWTVVEVVIREKKNA